MFINYLNGHGQIVTMNLFVCTLEMQILAETQKNRAKAPITSSLNPLALICLVNSSLQIHIFISCVIKYNCIDIEWMSAVEVTVYRNGELITFSGLNLCMARGEFFFEVGVGN